MTKTEPKKRGRPRKETRTVSTEIHVPTTMPPPMPKTPVKVTRRRKKIEPVETKTEKTAKTGRKETSQESQSKSQVAEPIQPTNVSVEIPAVGSKNDILVESRTESAPLEGQVFVEQVPMPPPKDINAKTINSQTQSQSHPTSQSQSESPQSQARESSQQSQSQSQSQSESSKNSNSNEFTRRDKRFLLSFFSLSALWTLSKPSQG